MKCAMGNCWMYLVVGLFNVGLFIFSIEYGYTGYVNLFCAGYGIGAAFQWFLLRER